MLGEEKLEEVDNFTYLGSVISKNGGGTEEDIGARIGKARAAYLTLKNIWRSKEIGRRTKIRIFNSNVKAVLLYGSETWRTTKSSIKRVQAFVNRCLRRILNVYWPRVISNATLLEETGQQSVMVDIRRRKWRWLGHTLRRPRENITREALAWNPQGKRKRGRPRNTWRRDLEAETTRTGLHWRNLEKIAQDRGEWKTVVDGLCPLRG